MKGEQIFNKTEQTDRVECVQDTYELYYKRILDVAISFVGLLLLSPIFLAISVAIFITDPGPVLFTQKRVGSGKIYFKLHKFRTMKMSTPHDVPTHQLENPEQYITRVGGFLRRTSLDELPQIWDILRGKMSIIGPRPALWNQYDLIAERDKYNANSVLPGLTGWAQINGRDELEIPVKAKRDGEYVKILKQGGYKALFFDVKCFIRTLCSVIKHDGVVEGGTGERWKQQKRKKSILVICQYYAPEPFRISDICEELVKRGHEVMVVTGWPNYPEGKLYPGYENKKHQDEFINGVRVHRCWTVPRGMGNVKRLLNYYSYAMSSVAYVKSGKAVTKSGRPFDLVFCNQLSPVMMAEAAVAYKKKYKVPYVHYCLDLWPVSLQIGGISEDSAIYKYFDKISERIYRYCDILAVTSMSSKFFFKDCMQLGEEKIEYLPQYAEDLFCVDKCKKEEDGHYDLCFAGVIGQLQAVETIIQAAQELKQRQDITFHIVGDGVSLSHCKELAKGLTNVVFYGRLKVGDMPEIYSKMDAMLVTMVENDAVSSVMPGKIQSYMAAGKPIIGSIGGETEFIINEAKCGYVCKPGNGKALKEVIIRFTEDMNKDTLGKNSRKFYEEHFRKEIFFNKFDEMLDRVR